MITDSKKTFHLFSIDKLWCKAFVQNKSYSRPIELNQVDYMFTQGRSKRRTCSLPCWLDVYCDFYPDIYIICIGLSKVNDYKMYKIKSRPFEFIPVKIINIRAALNVQWFPDELSVPLCFVKRKTPPGRKDQQAHAYTVVTFPLSSMISINMFPVFINPCNLSDCIGICFSLNKIGDIITYMYQLQCYIYTAWLRVMPGLFQNGGHDNFFFFYTV